MNKSYNILIGIFLMFNLAFLGFFINYTISQKNIAKQNQIKEEQHKEEQEKIKYEKEIEKKEREVQEELMNDSFYVSLLNSKKNCTDLEELKKIIELMKMCERAKRLEKGLPIKL